VESSEAPLQYSRSVAGTWIAIVFARDLLITGTHETSDKCNSQQKSIAVDAGPDQLKTMLGVRIRSVCARQRFKTNRHLQLTAAVNKSVFRDFSLIPTDPRRLVRLVKAISGL